MRPLWVEGRTVHQVGLAVSLGTQRRGDRRCRQRPAGDLRGAQRAHHGNQGVALRHRAWTPRARTRGARATGSENGAAGMSATITGFLTDSTICIGCKACEVACKEWNGLAADGFNWTGQLLRQHQRRGPLDLAPREVRRRPSGARLRRQRRRSHSWEFSSDVCKHCENAGCLEACPTGAIVRTEFGGVFVQPDVCNGCGYCVVACPFGVVQTKS